MTDVHRPSDNYETKEVVRSISESEFHTHTNVEQTECIFQTVFAPSYLFQQQVGLNDYIEEDMIPSPRLAPTVFRTT